MSPVPIFKQLGVISASGGSIASPPPDPPDLTPGPSVFPNTNLYPSAT